MHRPVYLEQEFHVCKEVVGDTFEVLESNVRRKAK